MGRNKEVNDKMKEERRERILVGALELFALNGLAGTRISDIARHTGMSNGLIYHYFASKEEIYTELIRTALNKIQDACQALESMELSASEKIKYALDRLVYTIHTKLEAGLFHLLVTQAIAAQNIPEEAAALLEDKRKIPHDTIVRIIKEGQKMGTIRQGRAEDLAFFFWVNINGIAQQQVMYRTKARQPQLELLYALFFTEYVETTDA